MYLYNRNSRIIGGGGAVMTDLVAITDFVNRNTELEMSLWAMAVGAEPGSISWSGNVQKRSELVDASDKLLPRDEYWNMVERVRPHITPLQDGLATPLRIEGEIPSDPEWCTVVFGQVDGSLPSAVGWSTEMAGLVHEITGAPLMLLANSIGPMGQLAFMAFADTLDALEENTMTLWQDERYMAKLGEATGMFQAGVGGSSNWRKIH